MFLVLVLAVSIAAVADGMWEVVVLAQGAESTVVAYTATKQTLGQRGM